MKRRVIIVLNMLLFLSSWIFANVDLKVGDIRLVIEDYSGSVSLYRKAEGGEFIPLFDSKSFTSNSVFYVLFDKTVYKVSKDAGFTIESKSSIEENIATMICTLKNKLSLTITYTLFSSVVENPEDSVKVNIEFTNLDDTSHLIGIKAVFDTWLAENAGIHFTTVLRDKLNTEYYFTNIDQDQWIESANEDVAVRFLLSGDQVTRAQTIAVANKDVFSNLIWTPPLSVGKGFDSLYSYNNSALSIAWQPLILSDNSSKKIQFYISTAAGKNNPVDIRFLRNNPAATDFFSDSIDNMDLNHFIDIYPDIPDSDDIRFFDSDDVIEIRRLLAIIRELESDSSSVNREEILQLNAEVDLIFEKLGR